MGRILFFIILLLAFSCREKRQQSPPATSVDEPFTPIEHPKEPLVYYFSKESLIGVKDSEGRIVIPARGRPEYDLNDGDTVEEGLIHLFEFDDTLLHPIWSDTPNSWGKVYSRNGKFLYKPLMYDNGPDRIWEGLTRFVENGKIGFVDRHANIVIPARFARVGSFELGTAIFSTGGKLDTTGDWEHPTLKGAVYGVIDRKGKILLDTLPYDTGIYFWKNLRSLHQRFYPGEFRYSPFEKRLLAKFDPYKKAFEKQYFSNWSGFANPKSLKFDITERPSPGFPFYVIDLAELVGNDILRGDDLQFYISADGKNIFYKAYGGELVPFKEWFIEYINEK